MRCRKSGTSGLEVSAPGFMNFKRQHHYSILHSDTDEVDYTLTRREPERKTAVSRKSIAAFISMVIINPDSYVNAKLGIGKSEKQMSIQEVDSQVIYSCKALMVCNSLIIKHSR